MSTVAWLDCSVAAAGDMLLAALIDAGASQEAILEGLNALGLTGWSLEVSEVSRRGFRALRVQVHVDGVEADGFPHRPLPSDDHDHHHGEHDPHQAGHSHRPWRIIRDLIDGSSLPPRVKSRALAAYQRLAEAEAHLHGMAVDDVALHEVGATDAIIDVVGVCLALEDLEIDRLVATPLPMGVGRIQAAHGTLPLPAPATLQVLRGWPIVPSPWPGEWVTPTGATLVAALATPGGPPPMIPRSIGHGSGGRNPPQVANLVRVVVGEDPVQAPRSDTVVELSTNVDDMIGELVPDLIAKLLHAGARDAWAVPVVMKKGRPGLVLHALARPADADGLCELMLRHSSSLGVRRHVCTRSMLDRWFERVRTPWGEVRIKLGGRDGEVWHVAPEYEDVQAVADTSGQAALQVYQAALSSWYQGDK